MIQKHKKQPPPLPPADFQNRECTLFGPKIQALTPKQRAFCWYYAQNGCNGRWAYQLAYDSQSETAAHIEASRLLARRDITEAIHEVGVHLFDGLVAPAIAALGQIIQNPSHKQHAKMIEYVLDRRGFNVVSLQKVEHHHKIDISNVDDALLALAQQRGIAIAPPANLIPVPAISREAETVEPIVEEPDEKEDPGGDW